MTTDPAPTRGVGVGCVLGLLTAPLLAYGTVVLIARAMTACGENDPGPMFGLGWIYLPLLTFVNALVTVPAIPLTVLMVRNHARGRGQAALLAFAAVLAVVLLLAVIAWVAVDSALPDDCPFLWDVVRRYSSAR